MLLINSFSKCFGDKTVISNLKLEVKSGEIFSLIGPNGSGKTTLVKSIAGLLRPNSGEIKIGGVDMARDPAGAKSLIGYIPDEPNIWSGMTGEEFIQLTGALYSVPLVDRQKRIPELLGIFGLSDIACQYFDEYSRGNRQKFSILAALMHQPKLLLVDEPIVGLDPESAVIAKREFVKYAQSGGSVLLVTHTLSVAEEISHRIGILKKGELIATGTLSELRAQAQLGDEADLEQIYQKLSE